MFKLHIFEEVFFKNGYDVSWTVKILHYVKIQYAPKNTIYLCIYSYSYSSVYFTVADLWNLVEGFTVSQKQSWGLLNFENLKFELMGEKEWEISNEQMEKCKKSNFIISQRNNIDTVKKESQSNKTPTRNQIGTFQINAHKRQHFQKRLCHFYFHNSWSVQKTQVFFVAIN